MQYLRLTPVTYTWQHHACYKGIIIKSEKICLICHWSFNVTDWCIDGWLIWWIQSTSTKEFQHPRWGFSYVITEENSYAVMTFDVFLSNSKNKVMMLAILTKHLQTETVTVLKPESSNWLYLLLLKIQKKETFCFREKRRGFLSSSYSPFWVRNLYDDS